jgi:hypothetical protein
MRAVNDAVEDRVPERGIGNDFMPAIHRDLAGNQQRDAACARALVLGTRSYSSVATILKNRQDRKPPEPEQPSLLHENIRGPSYYH